MSAAPQVDISNKPSPHGLKNKLLRMLWAVVYVLLFRPSPRPLHKWRAMILRVFGGKVSMKAKVYPKAKIWGPWNLILGDYTTIADDVIVYCVATIEIGSHTTISQYTYLCGATHDHEHPRFLLVPKPITIGAQCWISADVFVAPGVSIGDGTVVGARSSVFKNLPAWKVCVGSPAVAVKDRVIRSAAEAASH